jgi:large subunit ribosomal protein L41
MQTRSMSKYLSKSATKRLAITTKRAGKGFYKGKGSTKEGRVNSKAQFQPDSRLKLQLIVPDLEGFKLKPYIASTASRFPPETRRELGRVD